MAIAPQAGVLGCDLRGFCCAEGAELVPSGHGGSLRSNDRVRSSSARTHSRSRTCWWVKSGSPRASRTWRFWSVAGRTRNRAQGEERRRCRQSARARGVAAPCLAMHRGDCAPSVCCKVLSTTSLRASAIPTRRSAETGPGRRSRTAHPKGQIADLERSLRDGLLQSRDDRSSAPGNRAAGDPLVPGRRSRALHPGPLRRQFDGTGRGRVLSGAVPDRDTTAQAETLARELVRAQRLTEYQAAPLARQVARSGHRELPDPR